MFSGDLNDVSHGVNKSEGNKSVEMGLYKQTPGKLLCLGENALRREKLGRLSVAGLARLGAAEFWCKILFFKENFI